MMNRYSILITALLLIAALIVSCSEGTIDTIYTNPDAIVDVLQINDAAEESQNIEFIEYDVFHSLGAALQGEFGATSYRVTIDSVDTTYAVDVGDTVFVNNLYAKEADAETQFEIFYMLTIRNDDGDEITKHLTTNPTRAHKSAYFLQLGDFNSPQRGWKFWGTTNLLNLSPASPSLVWISQEKGEIEVKDQIIIRNEFETLSPGDRITVRYTGRSDDILYLTTNEEGNYEREKFKKISDNVQEVKWTVSSSPSGKDYYYYAGVEIYRYETLAETDTTENEFFFLGMMYSIEQE